MKIGILTFHKPVNYGAFLQSYALTRQLSRDYPNAKVEIIDYIAPLEMKKKYINILRRIKKFGLKAGYTETKKIRMFDSFKDYLPLSEKSFSTNRLDLLYTYIERTYDVLIIGSDAVFNWTQNGYPSAFIPLKKLSIPVLTYAASVHGLRYFEEPMERISSCGKAFRNMEGVFVRDKCTEEFVKYCGEESPKHACDPTFLLSNEDLNKYKMRDTKKILEAYHLDSKKKYIVLMLQNELLSKRIYDTFSSDYIIVSLFMNNNHSDAFLYDLNPFEWASVIKEASLVVTNYFHGTLLALEQGTPTIVLDISHYFGEYEGKLKDLMVSRLNLGELYFQVENIGSDENINNIITVAHDAINGEYKNRIAVSVERERDSYDGFKSYLSRIISRE